MENNFLNNKAEEISSKFNGNPPVIIVVGGIGTKKNDLMPKSVIWGRHKASRLRERIGILHTAIERDSYLHYENQKIVAKK